MCATVNRVWCRSALWKRGRIGAIVYRNNPHIYKYNYGMPQTKRVMVFHRSLAGLPLKARVESAWFRTNFSPPQKRGKVAHSYSSDIEKLRLHDFLSTSGSAPLEFECLTLCSNCSVSFWRSALNIKNPFKGPWVEYILEKVYLSFTEFFSEGLSV